MRLVLATPLYPPEAGGPATYARLLMARLPACGIDVELVKFSDVRHLPKFLRHVAYYRRVLKALRKADAVLALDPVSTGLPASRAARKAGKPFYLKVVGDYAWEQGVQRFSVTEPLDAFAGKRHSSFFVQRLQAIEASVAKEARAVIVPSEYLKGIVASWGVAPERIKVVRNGVSVEHVGEVPEAVARLPKPLVVSVGRLVPWKGMEGVIDAVATLPVSLAIAGDGPQAASLKTHASSVLQGQYVFAGRLSHEDTLATVKAADVFVLNSSYEGLSHLLLEALALGTPAVATDAGGNREVLPQDRLVPIGDTDALREAIRRSLGSASREAPAGETVTRMIRETASLLTA